MNIKLASLLGTMWMQLNYLSAEPLNAYGAAVENEELLDRQLYCLHTVLTIHQNELDAEWLEIMEATASMDAWQEYNA